MYTKQDQTLSKRVERINKYHNWTNQQPIAIHRPTIEVTSSESDVACQICGAANLIILSFLGTMDDSRYEDSLKNTASILDSILNQCILLYSNTAGVNLGTAMQDIIEILKSKLEADEIITCGAGRKTDKIVKIAGVSDGRSVLKVIKERERQEHEAALKNISKEIAEATYLGKRHTQLEDVSEIMTEYAPSKLSGLKLTVRDEVDEEIELKEADFSKYFKNVDKQLYFDLISTAKVKVIQVDPAKYKKNFEELLTAIKYCSPSVGIHEKLHMSSPISMSEIKTPQRVAALSVSMMHDLISGGSSTVPDEILAEFNQIIKGKQNNGYVGSQKFEVPSKVASAGNFKKEETIVYVSKGINGRPDAVLRAASGKIIAVVEFKGCTNEKLALNHHVGLKQAALYQYLVDAQYAYVCVYSTGPAKFATKVYSPSQSLLDKLPDEIDNMRSNFQMLAGIIAERFK